MSGSILVIMAAGIGSRFGSGIKQLEPVGPNGEIIMDYSIYDAREAGFRKVIFIIRKDLEKDFRENIGKRIQGYMEVEYVFQDIYNLPEGYHVPADRVKPWGTGQAILSCSGIIDAPFVVINADDYYGKEAYLVVHEFLNKEILRKKKYHFCMAGFLLGNTLSDNGGVTRGVCMVDMENKLVDIKETRNIIKSGDRAIVKDTQEELDLNRPVSMNMWGFTPDMIDELREGFPVFLEKMKGNELEAEYLLPTIIGDLIAEGMAEITVLKTHDKWFGVTYKEDKVSVSCSIKELTEQGVYPEKLF